MIFKLTNDILHYHKPVRGIAVAPTSSASSANEEQRRLKRSIHIHRPMNPSRNIGCCKDDSDDLRRNMIARVEGARMAERSRVYLTISASENRKTARYSISLRRKFRYSQFFETPTKQERRIISNAEAEVIDDYESNGKLEISNTKTDETRGGEREGGENGNSARCR